MIILINSSIHKISRHIQELVNSCVGFDKDNNMTSDPRRNLKGDTRKVFWREGSCPSETELDILEHNALFKYVEW